MPSGSSGHGRGAADAGPYSLAIFRIALFVVVLRLTLVAWPRAVAYSALPRSTIVPPWPLGHVLRLAPLSPGLARAAGSVLLVACALGIAGLFARTAAAVTAAVGVYFLGIPNFFGKVDHTSHVLWFAALLAVSPCADVLSVDGVRRAWRRADTGDVAPPAPSRAYGLPIRLVWLLIGCLYFFPGWWKVRSDGLHWAWSDNVRNIAYKKWAETGRTPSFAAFVESHGLLMRLAAVATLVFELGFVVALLWRVSRWVFAGAGLAFHLVNRAVLYIDFWALYWLYVVFVPWEDVLPWAGRRLFPRDAVAVYDDGCGICRRTVATLSTLDLLGRVTWVGASVADVGVPREELLADLHYVEHDRTTTGFDAYRRIARRYPVLWPLLPFAYLPGVPSLGRRVYRHVADTRACAVAPLPEPTGETLTPPRRRALATVFGCIAVPAVLLGSGGVENAWPISMYPSFRGYRDTRISRIDATANGVAYDLRATAGYSVPAWSTLAARMNAATPDLRERWARMLYDAACSNDPSLRSARVVVLLSVVSTRPSERGDPPLSSVTVASYGP